MRNTIMKDTLLGLFMFTAFVANSQNVGINSTGAAPNASAILDLSTGVTNMGFLAPQASLTSVTDVATIPAPATGLIVYNTNAAMGSGKGYYYWNGVDWILMVGNSGNWSLTGNSGTTVGTNYLGTNDANALEFKVNGFQSGWLDYLGTTANSFYGYKAGLSNTGQYNTGIGYEALNDNTSGNTNTGVGYGASLSNSTGSANTSVGYDALFHNTVNNNTAVGYYALATSNSGINNTAMGYESDWLVVNQNGNTSLGAYSLDANISGCNTAIGYYAGSGNTSGSYNTFLGLQSSESSGAFNNSTAIGANSFIGGSNVMVLGSIFGVNGGTSDIDVGIGADLPTQKLNVNNGNILISNYNIGSDGATVGQLQLQGTGTGISTFQAGAQGATNYNYVLPTTAPSGGDVLSVSAYAAPTVTLQWTAEPNALIGVKIITANTAATVFDAGTTWILFKVIGGGGAGGGVNYVAGVGCITGALTATDMAGSGGGAGAYSEGYITGLTGGVSTYAVTIGAGGVGTAACDYPAAGNGTQTQLIVAAPAYTITCAGGSVGGSLEEQESHNTFFSLIGGLGGTLPVNANSLNIAGATGGYATITQAGTPAAESGPGANSYFEGGASGFEERDVVPVTGVSANAYGSGGGGACYANATSGSAAGGNGSPGIVLIYEYR